MAKHKGTNTRAEQIEAQNIIQRTMSIPPEARAYMIGARANSVLGDRAFQRILKLDVGNLRIVSTWISIVADIKELQLHEKQSAHTSGQEGEHYE
jgi:hypothetical protein